MALIALKCPQCGGDIELESVKEIGFCMYCGSKVVIQEALKHEVTVDESRKIEAWVMLGCDALKSGNFIDAERYANKIIETELKNPIAWYVKGCCAKKEDVAREYWKKALLYSDSNNAVQKLSVEALNGSNKYSNIKIAKKWSMLNEIFRTITVRRNANRTTI
ncbi:MAG TPA: hypothetical protein PKO24_04860 [Methanomassiliicoccales archaeon]|nr:hypothetical protein [Methanomassiliicoccales archaeon]HQM67350.1 hypothetical protein [Methanomassiliicoccales archaeon]